MKKIIILLSLLLLAGCTKSNEQMEYTLFKSSVDNGMPHRAYHLTYNEWINEDTIEKLKQDPEVEVDDAYMFPIVYKPNGIAVDDIFEKPVDWHLIINNEETRNRENGLGFENGYVIPYQYYAIAPFKGIEVLEKNCVKKYNGEIKEGCIPIYLSTGDPIYYLEEIEQIEENYDDELLLKEEAMVPVAMHDGIYDMKVISITFQIVGFYKSPGGMYDYIPLEDMNRIVQENAEGEIKPMDYIITTNEKKAKQIRKMEDHLYLCPRWSNDLNPLGEPFGLIDEDF